MASGKTAIKYGFFVDSVLKKTAISPEATLAVGLTRSYKTIDAACKTMDVFHRAFHGADRGLNVMDISGKMQFSRRAMLPEASSMFRLQVWPGVKNEERLPQLEHRRI